MSSYSADTRVKAAQVLLEHFEGKPTQPVAPSTAAGEGRMSWKQFIQKVREAGPPKSNGDRKE